MGCTDGLTNRDRSSRLYQPIEGLPVPPRQFRGKVTTSVDLLRMVLQ